MLTNSAITRMLNLYKTLTKGTLNTGVGQGNVTFDITWGNVINNKIKTGSFYIVGKGGNEYRSIRFSNYLPNVNNELARDLSVQYFDRYDDLFKAVQSTDGGKVGYGKKVSNQLYDFVIFEGGLDNVEGLIYKTLSGSTAATLNHALYSLFNTNYSQDLERGDYINVKYTSTSSGGTATYTLVPNNGVTYEVSDDYSLGYDLSDYTSESLNLTEDTLFRFNNGIEEGLVKE